MKITRTLLPVAAIASAILALSAWAATAEPLGDDRPAESTAFQVAHAMPMRQGSDARAGSATSDHADQMKAMQGMLDRMHAATTPEARDALMAEQMQIMQEGMNMMDSMSAGTGEGEAEDGSARPEMMDERMDMMQMMMDRMQPAPATK